MRSCTTGCELVLHFSFFKELGCFKSSFFDACVILFCAMHLASAKSRMCCASPPLRFPFFNKKGKRKGEKETFGPWRAKMHHNFIMTLSF